MPRDLRAGDLVSLQLTSDGAAAAVSLHPLVHATDGQAAVRPAGSGFRLPPSSFAAMDADEAIRPPPQPFREASETVDRAVRQRRLAAARISRCMNALRLLEPDAASRLLAVAPRADEQFGRSLALAVATSENGGVRSLIASDSVRPEKPRGEVEAALDAFDALFAPAAVDLHGAGRWMMRRVPLLRDGIVDTVIWAVQEETDAGVVRFAIDLGPGLFGASQIQCDAAGHMLDIRIVTEQAPPAEAERSAEKTSELQTIKRSSYAIFFMN